MATTITTADIAAVVAAADFGTPSARKTGRNPNWPYVPVVMHGERQEQVLAIAYATRREAVAAAARTIAARRDNVAKELADPRFRALREQYGLPREITR